MRKKKLKKPEINDEKSKIVEAEVVEESLLEEHTDNLRPYDADYDADDVESKEGVVVTDADDAEDALSTYSEDTPGLVSSTPLQQYLSQLRKYPLMTKEEEHEVALRAYEDNDMEARQRLVTSNLRLVVKIAMEYRRAYSQILDLIQEGNAGLLQAVNRFNPYRNVKLSTYSAWWIRAYILKFLMDNKSLVRMGTTDAQRKLFFKLRSEAEKMYALTQRFDAQLLAEKIGVEKTDVEEMQQRLTKNDMSLDATVDESGHTRQIDLLSAGTSLADDAENNEVHSLIREQISEIEKELNERDCFIFQQRIIAEEPLTLQEIGDKFGVSRERARQLEVKIIQKIKKRFEKKRIAEKISYD